jgi:exodeoxyribonuclease-3
MIRIATVNVNGIRAAERKGLMPWLTERDCDVVAMQEVRAPDEIVHTLLADSGYHVVHTEANQKGRAGVLVATRTKPTAVRIGLDESANDSGRWIEADLEINGEKFTVVSVYVHSGEVGTTRQDDKFKFLDAMIVRLTELKKRRRHTVVMGDLNVGHTELDIKNWKANQKRSGFLPEERAYFDRFFGELGWVDVARHLAGEVPGPYTWWSQRGQAFDNDTGWRIDYHVVTPKLAATAVKATVDKAPSWDTRWSDHAPLVVDYDL